MADWTQLKDKVKSIIRLNNNQEINGQNLQDILVDIIDQIGVMSSADKSKLDNYPIGFVKDLGTVTSEANGDSIAAQSEIAGNRSISFIRYTVQGIQELKVIIILQWCNGINEAGQLKYVDKSTYRRNVKNATGVAGAATTATMWERTGAHYLGYDSTNRKLQLKDYSQIAFRDVEIPLATSSTSGLMSNVDKQNLDNALLITVDITNTELGVLKPVSSTFTFNKIYETAVSTHGKITFVIQKGETYFHITPLYIKVNTLTEQVEFLFMNPTSNQLTISIWELEGDNWRIHQETV